MNLIEVFAQQQKSNDAESVGFEWRSRIGPILANWSGGGVAETW